VYTGFIGFVGTALATKNARIANNLFINTFADFALFAAKYSADRILGLRLASRHMQFN
jgi:hypothetical protein